MFNTLINTFNTLKQLFLLTFAYCKEVNTCVSIYQGYCASVLKKYWEAFLKNSMSIALVALCKHFCLHIFTTPFKSEAQTCVSHQVSHVLTVALTKQQHVFAYGTWKATKVRVWTNMKHPPYTGQPWIIFWKHSPVSSSRQCPRSDNHELVKVTHSAHDRGWCHTGPHHKLLHQQEQWQFPESSSYKDCKTGWQKKYPGI